MIKKLLPMGTALFLTICFIFVIDIYLFLTTPAGKKKIIKNVPIARGTSFTQIAEELKKKKIIRDMRKFSLLARLRGDVSTIKAGEYALNTAMTPLKVLAILTKGAVIRYKVTIPEGFDIYQVASLLGREGVVNEDLFVKRHLIPPFFP